MLVWRRRRRVLDRATSFGDQLFVAGQVPRDRSGDLVGVADPAVQATLCLDNLRTLSNVHDFTEAEAAVGIGLG